MPICLVTPVTDPREGGTRSHLAWSKLVARAVSRRYGFGRASQEERDLEQTAAAELTRKLRDFDPRRVSAGGDPDMAFRGWVQRSVKSACEREALRMKNGGTYHTTRYPERVSMGELAEDVPDESPSASVEIGDVRCRMSGVELTVEGAPDLHTWAVAVGELDRQRERTLWMLGDLVLYGTERFGADAWDQLGALGYASESAKQARRVCAKFPAGSRLPQVTFGHHQAVARLELNKALAMLRRAIREKLTRKQLRDLVRPEPVETASRSGPVLSRSDKRRLPAACERHGVSVAVVMAVLKELRA